VRVHFRVTINLGCQSSALSRALYEIAAPVVPDQRWDGHRQVWRFWADDERYASVRSLLVSAAEVLGFEVTRKEEIYSEPEAPRTP
jgi:hypothetical protein